MTTDPIITRSYSLYEPTTYAKNDDIQRKGKRQSLFSLLISKSKIEC